MNHNMNPSSRRQNQSTGTEDVLVQRRSRNVDYGGVPPPLPENLTYTSCYCEENIYLLAEQFEGTEGWEVYVVFISNDSKTVALWNQRSSKRPEMGNVVIWDYHVVLVLRAVTVQDGVPSSELLEHYPEAYCDSVKNNGETDTDNARGNESQGRSTGRLGYWQQTRSEAKRDHTQPGLLELDSEHGSTDNDTLPIAWVYDLDSCANAPCSFSEYMRRTFPYSPVIDESEGGWKLPESFASLFRVIPAAVYLDQFVSDRSHMLIEPPCTTQPYNGVATHKNNRPQVADGPPSYSATPPTYAPLRGRKRLIASEIRTNLMESFVSMHMSGRSRKQPLVQPSHFGAENTHSTILNDAGNSQGTSHDIQPDPSITKAVLPSYESLQECHGAGGCESEGYGEVMDTREFLVWGGFRR